MTDKLYAPMPEPELFFIEDLGLGDRARYEGHTPEQMRAFADACCALREAQPIDMILYCPSCGVQHVDKPEGQFYPGHTAEESAAVNKDHGLWDNPPHRSHLCHSCGCIWRPADVPTNGVESIKTEGKADTWPAQAAQRPADSWRDAVQDELTTLHLSCPDDPRQAIKDMIEWNVRIALDPTVSSDAQALIERGRQEAQRPAAPAPQDSREAFEAWFDGEYQELARIVGDGVAASIRNASRNAWQAALASRPVPPPISEALEALAELVALKDIKDECLRVRQRRPQSVTRKFPQDLLDAEADYNRRKPLAWTAARAIIAARDAQ